MTYPIELTSLKQWVCVGADKVPMQATTPANASSNTPFTWDSYAVCKRSVELGNYQYLGFVFTEADGFVGIDIDTGFDPGGVMPTAEAMDIIDHCKSYTEISKSGRGFHIICKGKLPFSGKNNGSGIEIYQSNRYFVMTGKVVLYNAIRECQAAIDYILDNYFKDIERTPTGAYKTQKAYNPEWVASGNGISLQPNYPNIIKGNRHNSLLSLAGQLWSAGYSTEVVLHDVNEVNDKMAEPLSRKEVESICKSVFKYRR